MLPVTKKWLFLKISSAILLPLMLWFIINLVNIYDKSYFEIVNFLTTQPSKFLIGLFLVIAYFFSALTISEVFEDYINDKKTKNADLPRKTTSNQKNQEIKLALKFNFT